MLNSYAYENFMRLVIARAVELAKKEWEEEGETLRNTQFVSNRSANSGYWEPIDKLATFYDGKKDARWQVIIDLEEFLQERLEQLRGER